MGSIAYDLDRYRDCADAFEALTRLKPDGAPGWTMLGLCEYRLRNYGIGPGQLRPRRAVRL